MFYENLMNYPSFVPGYLPNTRQSTISDIQRPRPTKEVFTTPEEGYIRGNLSNTTYDPYKGYIPRKPILNSKREEALYLINVYNFAVAELSMYLDLHPNDQDVLLLLVKYNDEAKRALSEYNRSYGILNFHSVGSSTTPYEHKKGPWPWERN